MNISGRVLFGSQKKKVPEDNKELNVAYTPLERAREYAKKRFKQEGKNLHEVLPNFDRNYQLLQKTYRHCKDIPRDEMPVIRQDDMDKFKRKIKKGHIDIFEPHARTDLWPEQFKSKRHRKEWLTLGLKDGKLQDDVLRANMVYIPARQLNPLQSETSLKETINKMVKYSIPEPGSHAAETPIIVSSDKVILDGHHRVAQVMLTNPNMEMKCLYVPLTTNTLLQMTETYGRAIGNEHRRF